MGLLSSSALRALESRDRPELLAFPGASLPRRDSSAVHTPALIGGTLPALEQRHVGEELWLCHSHRTRSYPGVCSRVQPFRGCRVLTVRVLAPLQFPSRRTVLEVALSPGSLRTAFSVNLGCRGARGPGGLGWALLSLRCSGSSEAEPFPLFPVTPWQNGCLRARFRYPCFK